MRAVVLNWNGAADTIRCVESLFRLGYPRLDVSVVDNASTDDSIQTIRGRLQQVDVIANRTNSGYAGGNNLGILSALAAQVDFVWILNNDTEVGHGALDALIRESMRDPDVAAIGATLVYADRPQVVQLVGGGRVNLVLGTAKHNRERGAIGRVDYVSGACLFLRAAAVRDIGLLDESYFMYFEDIDWSFRAKEKGWRLAVAHDAVVAHRESASLGASSPRTIEMFNRSAVRFFSHYGRWPVVAVLVGLLGRLVKQVVRLNLHNARAILAVVMDTARARTWVR